MAIQESGEMYLETIYILSNEQGHVRAIDISEKMGYSKPSVSRALGLLKADGHIVVDEGGSISLTESGKEIATHIYERHTILSKVFMSLGVDEKTATDDACRIEHYISDRTFDALKKHFAEKR